MTLQEYFDKTVEHLAKQKDRAITADDLTTFGFGYRCVFLNEKGMKCAVGVHIPDGHPAQVITEDLDTLAMKFPDLCGIAWPDHYHGLDLARMLQGAHDVSNNRSDLVYLLEMIAKRYNLSPEKVELITEWKGRQSP